MKHDIKVNKQQFIEYLEQKLIPNFKTMGMEATAGDFQKCMEYLEAPNVVYGFFYTYAYSGGGSSWTMRSSSELYRRREAAEAAMSEAIDTHKAHVKELGATRIMIERRNITEYKIK